MNITTQRYINRESVKGVTTFTYLGSTLAEDGELDAEVTHRVQSGWKNWKRVSGVLCDRRMDVKGLMKCTTVLHMEEYVIVHRPYIKVGLNEEEEVMEVVVLLKGGDEFCIEG